MSFARRIAALRRENARRWDLLIAAGVPIEIDASAVPASIPARIASLEQERDRTIHLLEKHGISDGPVEPEPETIIEPEPETPADPEPT